MCTVALFQKQTSTCPFSTRVKPSGTMDGYARCECMMGRKASELAPCWLFFPAAGFRLIGVLHHAKQCEVNCLRSHSSLWTNWRSTDVKRQRYTQLATPVSVTLCFCCARLPLSKRIEPLFRNIFVLFCRRRQVALGSFLKRKDGCRGCPLIKARRMRSVISHRSSSITFSVLRQAITGLPLQHPGRNGSERLQIPARVLGAAD
jgi:hypothetical protein